MKFLFDDASFSFETLRATGFAVDGGADIADVLATAAGITEGDETTWHREWKATAQRIHSLGQISLDRGHKISARDAFLRASNYYRVAEFYRREDPVNDPEVLALSRLSRDAFKEAAALMDNPVEDVSIPYLDRTLPAYLLFVDASRKPRPTVIYTNGFDSTPEEGYFVVAAAALRRGYNVLLYDGPGQGAAIREDDLVFRPDWEAVIGPVIDYALTRPEVSPDGMILFGYSLGAYLVARAAAFDKRAAALVLDDGMFDLFEANVSAMPSFLVDWVRAKNDAVLTPLFHMLMARDTQTRWGLRNGLWTFGLKSIPEYLRSTAAYTLDGIVDKIAAPTLILEGEEDHFLTGQAQRVAAALKCPHTLVTLRTSEGAGSHAHMGAMRRFHQVMFDWLDETVARA